MKAITRTQKFYQWYMNLGADVGRIEIDKIHNRLNQPKEEPPRSLYLDPLATKTKFNHKFTKNE
jgi:hypothetical protein